jgi:hypothetical protein
MHWNNEILCTCLLKMYTLSINICGTHMEFSYLTNVIKINHQDMTNCGYNVIFYDVAILN